MNILLLPGYGGKYTTPVLGTASTADEQDTLDCSRIAQLAVQVIHDSGTPAGTCQLEQTLDGEHWAAYGDTINVATNGNISLYGIEFGPIGRIRINPESISSGEVHLIVVGRELQGIA